MKQLNKIVAILIVMSMLLYTLGGIGVFAEVTDLKAHASANFDDAAAAEAAYQGMTFVHNPRRGVNQKYGTPVLAENDNPYYDKLIQFAQTSPGSGDSTQWLEFRLDDSIKIGTNTTAGTYAEFSYDVMLAKATTGICFDFGTTGYSNGNYMYQLNLNGTGNLISTAAEATTHTAVEAGTNNVFHNVRIRADLYNKTIVGIYVNDELLVNLSASPIAWKNTDGVSTIDIFRIYIGKALTTDTLYIDNVNVVTYKSTDGTSPIASKAVLRSKIEELYNVVLSGSAKETFDNAVSLAKNPVAAQTDVDNAVEALNNLNTSGLPTVAASADFDDAAVAEAAYQGMTVKYNPRRGLKYGTPALVLNDNPYYDKMFEFTQTYPSDGNAENTPWIDFELTEPIKIGTNTTAGTYAEFSYDAKLVGAKTGICFDFGKAGYGNGGFMYQLNLGGAGALVSTGAASTTHTAAVEAGTNSVFHNIRVCADLYNKTIVGIYVNDELLVDLSEAPISWKNADSNDDISLFRIYIGKAGANDTLYIDNVSVVTYTTANGTSPVASKAALRSKIEELCEYLLESEDTAKIDAAAEVAKNPVAAQDEVSSALADLNTINTATATKIVAFEDFEDGADGSYSDFSYSTTYKGSAAATETIGTATDANPILNKMFSLLQGAQEGSSVKNMYPVANFTLKEAVDYTNATDGQFAEISFDTKVDVTSSTLACVLYDTDGKDIGQINIGEDVARAGVGFVDTDAQIGLYDTAGLENGFDRNVKLVLDLYNKQIDAVYIDGVRLLDRTADSNPITDIDFASDAASNLSKISFNWGNGGSTQHSNGYTFAIDNIRIMTYSGSSPEADKSSLLKAINANYATADSKAVANAVSVYKNITAAQDEIDAAVKTLLPAVSTYLSQIKAPQAGLYIDKLTKPDFSADGITVTCTSSPEGYIDENLNITQPTDKSVDVEITYTLARGDDTASVKHTVTVYPRVACEVNEIEFEDALGATVYSAQDGGKLKSVMLRKNTSETDLKLYTAVYENGTLDNLKLFDAADGKLTLDIPVNANSLVKFFVWQGDTLVPVQAAREAAKEQPTLHIIGDSIYADYSLDKYSQYAPDCGIGQMFSTIFAEKGVIINNKAVPGSSSKVWYENYLMDAILSQISQGDYVLISLCHNDQKVMDENQYKANLVRIANDVKEQGGIPFFVTAVPRYSWTDGTLNSTHGNYIQKMIDAGTENNIPVIDLNAHLRELYTDEGTTETTYEKFYSQAEGEVLDRTHLSETGASYCAEWIIEQFEGMGFPFVEYSKL